MAGPAIRLHIGIIRPSSALGDDPVDILGRVLDVAGLAVHAILRVDLQAWTARLLDELIDSRRAISLLRPRIKRQVDLDRYVRVLERQMDRLILAMVGVGCGDRGEPGGAGFD